MVLYLIRHAHAVWTPDVNRPLSERGQQDAQRVADLLSERPLDAVYASSERRAQQTVAPLAERLGLPLQITPALDERRLARGRVDDFQAVRYSLRVFLRGLPLFSGRLRLQYFLSWGSSSSMCCWPNGNCRRRGGSGVWVGRCFSFLPVACLL